jgi:hypothetical protein
MQTSDWFKARVNRRIFRDASGCPCHECADIVENGLIIRDLDHAEYLYCTQNEFANDGCMLNYRDYK